MKTSNTSLRLKQIMESRGLKQVDILSLCQPLCKKYGVKFGRNDISQYVSGKVEPKQDKLSVLAEALGVSEPFLMGYDDTEKTSDKDSEALELFSHLSEDNKKKVIDYMLLVLKASEQGE